MCIFKICCKIHPCWRKFLHFVYSFRIPVSCSCNYKLCYFLCSDFYFGQWVDKDGFQWDVWALKAGWEHLALGIPSSVLFMWLLCVRSVGYAALPIVQWLDPFHPSASSVATCLLYTCIISECHHQLSYSYSHLWGMPL